MTPHPETLVAGIGNIFLGDDGFGPEVVRVLAERQMPASAKVIDYGIRSLDLAYALLEPYSKIIFVDAIARGGPPGSIYLLEPADTLYNDAVLDPHSMDPLHLIGMARSLGEITARILIIGCEPLDFGDDLEGRMSLSPVVQRAVPEAVRAVLDLILRADISERGNQELGVPISHLQGEPV